MLEIGSLLDGKYKILNEIGHGGMSVVYLALNERANKTWAVKEVRKDGGNDTTVVSQNLVAETEMLKKLDHPNLPSIIDVIDKDDSFIIVMDYIEGNSLQDLIDTDGPQHPEKVIEWAKQLCDVLGYLHSRRPPIIYRDMKPANVMLRPTGDVTLIDFGTAREYKYANQADTTYLGTRGYAAPEQFGGRGQTDARTDIYTLGATMYHLITGYSPADTNFEVLPIGKFVPQLKGSGLEKIITKCCQNDPAKRYQDCAELMAALNLVLALEQQITGDFPHGRLIKGGAHAEPVKHAGHGGPPIVDQQVLLLIVPQRTAADVDRFIGLLLVKAQVDAGKVRRAGQLFQPGNLPQGGFVILFFLRRALKFLAQVHQILESVRRPQVS